MNPIKLSVCIATYNRAAYIGETLSSILSQLTNDIEVIVVDGASPDNTAQVVSEFAQSCPQLKYHRRETNRGVDEDFNYAVSLAAGEYCWLMSDDDILKPGAIQAVLAAISRNYGLILVNAEIRDKALAEVLEKRRLELPGDRVYASSQFEQFFIDTAQYLSFIGCVVIKKRLWDEREKEKYYGTVFIHVGVIFQKPFAEDILVIANPYIAIRYGNAGWSGRSFEIWMFKWPRLIWSFPDLSDSAKARVYPREPWKQAKKLLLLRGMGSYSHKEYDQFLKGLAASKLTKLAARVIAGLPGGWVNRLAQIYFKKVRPSPRSVMDLRNSKFGVARPGN
ncbi:MAG: hypothetical protein A2428_16460 [Bdellovibrionales bacterium RIFOXYC1_FULL_54_43]|nr:MAG: hypothetical protein A2428_16460 [Bdellovibrionales bacterium RIFOXYC1_FULL_54_43]OFZ83941.1 MAG: hypothetical protein A2603_10335 [Bdellovibrionales bacterium RIFOXYD1_FULL_55_31]